MAMLPSEFADNEDEMGSALAPGWYVLTVVKSEVKPTAKAVKEKGDNPNLPIDQYSGQRLNFQMKVVGGKDDGKIVFNGFNIKNPNPQAVTISAQEFTSMRKACGKPIVKNSEELHGIPFMAKLIVDADDRNVFKAYKAYDGAPIQQEGAAKPSPSGSGDVKDGGDKPKKKAWEDDED